MRIASVIIFSGYGPGYCYGFRARFSLSIPFLSPDLQRGGVGVRVSPILYLPARSSQFPPFLI